MAGYKPSVPFSTALSLLKPTYTKVCGVPTKTYPEASEGERFNGSFRTFGGTERDVNGLYSIEDTATVETWYRPDIQSDCRVALLGTDAVYEIFGEPENIDRRNQFLKFKVKRVKGGA